MIRIHDQDFIEQFAKHPAIWPHISDDDSAPIELWKPAMAPHIHWLMSEDCGALFMTYPIQPRLWNAHSQVLPGHRRNTVSYYLAAFEYLRQHTICSRLLGLVPAGNYRAKRAAEAAGMKHTTTLARCFRKGGKDLDMAQYELEIQR